MDKFPAPASAGESPDSPGMAIPRGKIPTAAEQHRSIQKKELLIPHIPLLRGRKENYFSRS
jgi:hypothetical protein